jgi:hypothetical protein
VQGLGQGRNGGAANHHKSWRNLSSVRSKGPVSGAVETRTARSRSASAPITFSCIRPLTDAVLDAVECLNVKSLFQSGHELAQSMCIHNCTTPPHHGLSGEVGELFRLIPESGP